MVNSPKDIGFESIQISGMNWNNSGKANRYGRI